MATAASAGAATADAADAAADAAEQGGITDIIVTAQKRETRLQETPAAISAISADSLEAQAITGLNDLTRAAPGLVVADAGPGERRISLRGIRSAGEAQVAVYYDEAPLTGPPGASSDAGRSQGGLQLFDVARVEVLRGPQGTLYGASSMGGTLRIIYQKPSDMLEAAVDLTGSNTEHAGDNYQLNAMVNLPIVGDRLALRAVAWRYQSAGWIDNPRLGAEEINKNESEGGRLLLKARPADWLDLDFGVHYSNEKGQDPVWAPSLGTFISPNTINLPTRDKNRLYTAAAHADLGFAQLVATGSLQDRDQLYFRDPYYLMQLARGNPGFCIRHSTPAECATPAGMDVYNAYVDSLLPMGYIYTQEMQNYSSEVRLQSNEGGLLDWTVGGYWSKRSSKMWSNGQLADSRGILIESAPYVYSRRVHDTLSQIAGFGEASLHLTERLTLTGGLRYYDYKRTVAGDTEKGFDLINFAIQPWTVRETSEKGPLWKANVSYQATPDVLFYAQAASGFRPGGANQVLGLPDAFTPYQSDSLWTYEAGAKTTLFDGQILFNLTGYLTDWDNMQVSGSSGTYAFLTNAGNARVKGIEAQTVVAPIRGLQFSADLSLLSAKLTTDQVNGLVVAQGKAGDHIPEIPSLSFSLSGQYEWAVGSKTALLRADYSYAGRSHSEFRPNSPLYRQLGDYSLVGLRAGIGDERFGVYLFVTNLFDTLARTRAGNMIGMPVEVVTTAPPRTIGLNLKFGI